MEAAPARLEGSAASRGAAQQAASLNQLSRPSTDSILRVTALVACVVAGLHVMTSRMAQAASMMLMALVSRRNTTVAWRKLMVWSCSMVRLHSPIRRHDGDIWRLDKPRKFEWPIRAM
jgi:hypothetical protein